MDGGVVIYQNVTGISQVIASNREGLSQEFIRHNDTMCGRRKYEQLFTLVLIDSYIKQMNIIFLLLFFYFIQSIFINVDYKVFSSFPITKLQFFASLS